MNLLKRAGLDKQGQHSKSETQSVLNVSDSFLFQKETGINEHHSNNVSAFSQNHIHSEKQSSHSKL